MRYKIQSLSADTCLRADLLYPWTSVSTILALNHEFYTTSTTEDPDVSGWCAFTYAQDYDMYLISNSVFHMAHPTNETWPKSLQPYEHLDPIPGSPGARIASMSSLIASDQSVGGSRRTIYKTLTFKPSLELQQKIVDMLPSFVDTLKLVPGILPAVVFQSHPPRAFGKGDQNPFGLDPSEGPLVNLNIAWGWHERDDDDLVISALDGYFDKIEAVARKMGVLHRFIYPNYAWKDQDVYASFGEQNLAKMQRIQKKTDPSGVFSKGGLCGGYFKINVKTETEKGQGDRVRDEL